MSRLNSWLGQGTSAIDEEARAVDAWGRIQRDPESITIQRGNSDLSAQTVRIEFDNQSGLNSEVKGGGGASARRSCIVFGVVDHPTVADTNIQRGDKFRLDGTDYRVVQVIKPPGEVQATAEALT